ncbi:dynactin subunit p27 [Polychytrium aggregatum]|uniref:dynactin subunit p27 n=1 Tax=Polychytrium aggregatum TaxID=110093 RepID=UPI0022FEE1E5|nr:dynactin subunit p27 [Polychytrium aggregatum]KAI9202597.1 dynactin subunit p27 [Polychytrium aggregatum]
MSRLANASTICEEAVIRGDVIFGANNVVHPKCRIVSEGGGQIFIGSNNIIEENVLITNWQEDPMYIGDDNIFEVGSQFEGAKMGNGCIVEPKAIVSQGTSIGDNCVIGAMCTTFREEHIPSDTVLFGSLHERRLQTKLTRMQVNLHSRHLDYLKEVLPKYHHLKPGKN